MKKQVKRFFAGLFAGSAGIGCWYFLTKTTLFSDKFGFFPGTIALEGGSRNLLYAAIVCSVAFTYVLFGKVCDARDTREARKKLEEEAAAQRAAARPVAAAVAASTPPVQQNSAQKQSSKPTSPSNPRPAPPRPQITPQNTYQETATQSASFVDIRKSKTRFSDIAGYEKTKKSMQFLVSCLANPDRLKDVGAKIPTGIMFYGPPGTGKTLFGQAIAGEANVPFIYLSGSSFVEKYVGVGAQRVRELFRQARENQPCVLFIDEIDAVGTRRGGEFSNEERQQTLNQLLVEINNLGSNGDRVLLIAATNRLDSLDPALQRPGRFDRKIAIPQPNLEDRLAILKLHCAKKKLNKQVDLKQLALMTEGMAGADLFALINEAAIQAVYQQHDEIEQEDINAALFQILTGGEQSEVRDMGDLRVIAYHEAGHALVTKLLTDDEVSQVSIIGSTSGALGLTMRHASKDTNLISKKQMETRLKVFYAGRAAEECFFGNSEDITTGASDDLRRASIMIRDYLTTYGMSSSSILNVTAFNGRPDAAVTEEAKALAERLYQETITFLKDHRAQLDAIANALLTHKILDADKLDEAIRSAK